MKIRKGFVSNSSSSSFVIIGKKIQRDKIMNYDKVLFKTFNVYDDTDNFILSDEMKEYILHNELESSYHVFIHEIARLENKDKINKTILKDILNKISNSQDYDINIMEIKQHYTNNLEDFIDKYGKVD